MPYSFVGIQTIYLATAFNPIYWNCACLIVNSGSLEDNTTEELVDIYEPEYQELSEGTTYEDLPDRSAKIKRTASTDYGKVAKALGDIMAAGIKISLVDINKSDFGFKPDPENNQILFGMKGMLNISDETVQTIVENRPYISPKDFLLRVKPKKQVMIALIKGGAFDKMIDRKICMAWYLWEICGRKNNLTLQNFGALTKYNLIPTNTTEEKTAFKVYEFNRYLKAVCKINSTSYQLDERAVNFLQEMNYDNLISNDLILSANVWNKYYQKWMDVYRNWIAQNKEEILNKLNELIFLDTWRDYAEGTLSSWEMEVLCFYYHEHELAHVDTKKYGFSNFFDLPEEPQIDKIISRGGKDVTLYKLSKICGTCVAKNKAKSTVALLTPSGMVNVKFRKEYFALFDKQISELGEDGAKHVVEKSFFNRGSMIIVTGMRSGNDFICKKYSSTASHQLYKITKIYNDGTLELQHERYKGENLE